MLEYLPLLDGWYLKTYQFQSPGQVVTLGQLATVMTKDKAVGWVIGVDFIASDAMMEYWIETEYAQWSMTPYDAFSLGLFQPPPWGTYVSLYNQPSPQSTYGTYAGSFITAAYPLPFRGKVKAYVTLGSASTQQAALAQYVINVLEVTDEDALIRSFQRLQAGLGARDTIVSKLARSLKVPPEAIEKALKT